MATQTLSLLSTVMRRDRIEAGGEHADLVARRNLDLARVRRDRRARRPFSCRAARLRLCAILSESGLQTGPTANASTAVYIFIMFSSIEV